jgi:hypothetical protein
MTTHTHQTVRDILQANWESDLPDKVLDALRPLDGKPVTKRLLDKLPGGKEEWILERAYGMTQLKNRAYVDHSGSGKGGVSLLLDHREDAFPLDVARMVEKNPAYFSARVERNHARMEAMNTKPLLDAMANVMNRIEQAAAELIAAKEAFEVLTEYGKPFRPDNFDLERACGLRKESNGAARPWVEVHYP